MQHVFSEVSDGLRNIQETVEVVSLYTTWTKLFMHSVMSSNYIKRLYL